MTLSVCIFLLCFSFSLVIYFSDAPLLLFKGIKKQDNCGAIAIRDNVIPFQKFGTRLFTWPYLSSAYNEVIYLTEFKRNHKRKEFIEGLNNLLNDNDSVDVFLLAHANEYYQWVQQIDSVKRRKIRLVYNTGCSGIAQKDSWLSLGAKYYVGHRSNESISPVFYFYFLRRWCGSEDLGIAVSQSNKNMNEKIKRLGININALILKESEAECASPYNLQ